MVTAGQLLRAEPEQTLEAIADSSPAFGCAEAEVPEVGRD